MTTTEEALDLAARMDDSGDYYRSNVSGGLPMAMYLEDAADLIRALVAERNEAQAKLAQVREWRKDWLGTKSMAGNALDAILAQPDDEAKEAGE